MKIAEFRKLKGTARRSKFGNVKTVYGDNVFHSKKEAHRAMELDILKRAGKVFSWEPQVPLPIEYRKQKICTYIADFRVKYPDGHI